MRLSFKQQFALAPLLVIVILASLVMYTLYELSNINRENETTRYWEVATDSVQAAINASSRVNKLINTLAAVTDLKNHDDFFNYIEQTKILSNTLTNPNLIDTIPEKLRQEIRTTERLLQNAESANLAQLKSSLTTLLPKLEHQYKIFSAKRRTGYIDYHRKLISINSRMTPLLLTGLAFCILIVVIVTFWGLRVVGKRLRTVVEKAANVRPVVCPSKGRNTDNRDELEYLEDCISEITQRLADSIGVESVLIGAEKERQRIAMDMHDGTLADLTALNRRIEAISSTELDPEKRQQLHDDISKITQELRRIINDLHPRVIDVLGLKSALLEFIKPINQLMAPPHVHLEFDDAIESTLTEEQKINYYRIIVEAITNAMRHADCSQVEVSVRSLQQNVVVSVEDNGKGMDTAQQLNHGYYNIKERARVLGATAEWKQSRFSNGTRFESILANGEV